MCGYVCRGSSGAERVLGKDEVGGSIPLRGTSNPSIRGLHTAITSAVDFVKQNQTKFDFYFLTNNTSKTPEDYVNKLANLDITCSSQQIITPLYALIDYIKSNQYTSVYLVANDKVQDFVQTHLPDTSLHFDLDENQAICLTYDTDITYQKLKNMAILLNNKDIPYIVTHSDIFCPTENGPIPDIGSFIQLLEATNSKQPTIILGKPSIHMIQNVISQYNIEDIAIIGDRLYTDKKLADNANCDFICVLSGDTNRLDIALDETKYPALVIEDLGKIV